MAQGKAPLGVSSLKKARKMAAAEREKAAAREKIDSPDSKAKNTSGGAKKPSGGKVEGKKPAGKHPLMPALDTRMDPRE